MLYAFFGTDNEIAVDKARGLVNSLRAKRPDAAYEKVEADAWSKDLIESHLGGQGLFSSKYIVFLDRVTENSTAKEELPDMIAAMQESTNIFIVLENKPNAELKKALEKHAEKIVTSDKKEVVDSYGRSGFNIFSLTDAIYTDPMKAWTIYRRALEEGMEPEAIIGTLFWKAKTVGDKRLAEELIMLYHDGHRGLVDLELGIEKLVLNCRKP